MSKNEDVNGAGGSAKRDFRSSHQHRLSVECQYCAMFQFEIHRCVAADKMLGARNRRLLLAIAIFGLDFTIRPLSWGAELASDARLNRTNLLMFRAESGAIVPVKSIADWQRRRASVLAAMQQVMGPLPGREKRCPLDIHTEEEVDCGSYLRRRISYASEPGPRVPAYLLIPKRVLAGRTNAPGILALHQTHPLGQKAVVGLANSTNDEYGVELAKRGYVVLAPPYPLLADYHPDLTSLGYHSGTMKAIWDNIRGLDLLESLPFVSTNGFGTIGHSLGGHNSIYTAVFD
jgi:hypothetical protein